MIELDMYNFISVDGNLLGLLGGSASDTHIYPNRAPQSKSYPYIVYFVSGYGDREEYLHQDVLTFKIVAEKPSEIRDIRDRLRVLLDLEDQINITSADYRIVWMKLVGGYDMEDPETRNPIGIFIFEGKFIKI